MTTDEIHIEVAMRIMANNPYSPIAAEEAFLCADAFIKEYTRREVAKVKAEPHWAANFTFDKK